MLVYTTKGLIERDRLELKLALQWQDNALVIAPEWYLDGEMVRRDCAVCMLRPLEITGEQGNVNGK